METIHSNRRSAASICLLTFLAALLFFGIVRIITAQGNPEAAKVKNPVASTPESIAAGKQVYTKSCAPCHGLNGEGGPGNDLIPAAPNLVDDKWDHGSSDGEIFDNIKNGIGPDFNMVPWKDMVKDPDIWNVVNYVRSIAKKKPEAAKSDSGK
jgi:mono/diheme cytochrome c family protein